MLNLEEIKRSRLAAADVVLSVHTDAISRTVFTDDDIGNNFTQLLTTLQMYAKEMGINFQAACDGDDDRLWDEPGNDSETVTVMKP